MCGLSSQWLLFSTFTKPDRPLTWLITGSSPGFGLSLTREVLSHGHTVIATSRNPARTPELVQEVESQGGRWLKLDVDDPTCGSIIDNLEAQGTHIDVLVNNAGWSVHNPVEQMEETEVRGMMETLYFGPYRLMRAVLPYMRKRRYGVIVRTLAVARDWKEEGAWAPMLPRRQLLDGKHNFQSAWVIHQEGRLVVEEGRV